MGRVTHKGGRLVRIKIPPGLMHLKNSAVVNYSDFVNFVLQVAEEHCYGEVEEYVKALHAEWLAHNKEMRKRNAKNYFTWYRHNYTPKRRKFPNKQQRHKRMKHPLR